MKDFVVSMSSTLNIGLQQNLVSVITYGSSPTLHFNLRRYTYQSSLLRAIRAIQHTGPGLTNTAAALQLLKGTYSLGLRSGYRHIAVVLTDGRSNSRTETMRTASSLHSTYHILAVGVGDNANLQELQGIASQSNYVFKSATTFSATTLKTFKTSILLQFNDKGMYMHASAYVYFI